MKDLILICAVVAVFVFGYFIMKKLDDFLDNNRRQISEDIGTHSLRIAFEMPALIASVADLLDRFSRENQNCELFLFYGSADEIEKDCPKINSILVLLRRIQSVHTKRNLIPSFFRSGRVLSIPKQLVCP